MAHEENTLFFDFRAIFTFKNLLYAITGNDISVYFVNSIFFELRKDIDLTGFLKHAHCSELTYIKPTYSKEIW